MKGTKIKHRVHRLWLAQSIHKKIGLFTGIVFLIISISFFSAIWIAGFLMGELRGILADNAKSIDFIDAIESESTCFNAYIKNPTDENYKELTFAWHKTESAIEFLPFDYSKMGQTRYAKTWSIRNSYQVYQKQRDAVLKMDEGQLGYIRELYKTYDMQEFLQEYGRNLMRYTLEEGTIEYQQKETSLKRLPIATVVLGTLLMSAMFSLAHLMNRSIVVPIMKLVDTSKRIAANDFYVEDVVVDNEDEIGRLVHAFNKMKYATGQYITTLEQQRETLDLLHQEELEKLEVEKHLESTKFQLLKSQINPHFLFNTLNVIGGMANLEDAETTEKMIKSLSSLFRYNLKTVEMEVSLVQELNVVQDYMYLQKMRFGSRIHYRIDCPPDCEKCLVPAFLFQPLIENAIIHGLSSKEEGGGIYLRIRAYLSMLIITITDTGAGMTKDQLKQLRIGLQKEKTNGIGLSNIEQRIHRMYKNGKMKILSKENVGTIIRIQFPKSEGGNHYVSDTDSR